MNASNNKDRERPSGFAWAVVSVLAWVGRNQISSDLESNGPLASEIGDYAGESEYIPGSFLASFQAYRQPNAAQQSVAFWKEGRAASARNHPQRSARGRGGAPRRQWADRRGACAQWVATARGVVGRTGAGEAQTEDSRPRDALQRLAVRVLVTMRFLQLYRTPFLYGLLWAICVLDAKAEEPGADHSHHSSVGLDKNAVHDQEHIMEHLEGVIKTPEEEMSPQELQLHYFKMHDYDGNSLLDGLELSTAISHAHKVGGNEQPPMSEAERITLIDGVLRDDDKNNDGYIDYAEFAKSLE